MKAISSVDNHIYHILVDNKAKILSCDKTLRFA